MREILNGERIVLGTCYYPEHWPENLWESDIDRMLESGIEAVRVAEFAWSKVELHEGEFNYEFWDRFLDLCDKKGMKVIFCTPTATPPAWLTEKYPEVLNADMDGNLYRHGSRRHYNYNSPVYREKSRIITEAFAKHYGKRACVMGWQLDNELNCEIGDFYSESDSNAFRVWVKEKYGTIENLNECWGTNFWNQTYTDWNEIYVPRKTVNKAHNQHQQLDYLRFISDSCISFAKEQSDIIRKYSKPGDFITTNGMFGHLDNHELNRECLDFYMYDSYPNFNNRVTKTDKDELGDRWWSRLLSRTRSISNTFGIMEQQTGANGWTIWDGVPTPRPGQITLWTLQSVAHGADYISFFRWRTCTYGTEIYWHGILDYSGRDNERLEEVRNIGKLMPLLKDIAGKPYEAKVAVIEDYDNNYDAEIDRWHGSLEWESGDALFKALQKNHTPFDYVNFYKGGISADLLKYKAVFWAHPVIVTEKQIKVLKTYVENGGILILGCRSGYKDEYGRCTMAKLPGLFAEMTGADVKEYSFIQPDISTIAIETGRDRLHARVFADRLSEETTSNIIGRYSEEYFAGDGAVSVNNLGLGKVYYYGSVFDEASVEYFLNETGTAKPYDNIIEIPAECEIAVRGNYIFVLNYTGKEQNILVKEPVLNIYSQKKDLGEITLSAYEVYIASI